MAKETRNVLLLCAAQIACVLGWDGFIVVYLFITKHPYFTTHPYFYLFSPLLIMIGVSLALSFLCPIKPRYLKAILISTPAILIYIGYYVVRPIFMAKIPEIPEATLFAFLFLMPSTVLALLITGLGIYLGSLIHIKIIKQEDKPVVN